MVSIIVVGDRWTETNPLSSLDVYKRPRILEGLDLKLILLVDLELTRW